MQENQKIIGDRTYTFGTIPPIEAIVVEVAIAKVIGEPLFRAFMDSKKTGNTEEEMNMAGGVAIGMLASKMEAKDLVSTMQTVFQYVGIAGVKTRVDINADFMGRNREVWQVFIAALRFNFSDFLPASLFASLQSVAKGASN